MVCDPALVVVRIVPRLAETRSLLLTRETGIRLARALAEGSSLEGSVSADWIGDPSMSCGDYPSWSARAPVFSARLARELGPSLRGIGDLLPVAVGGTVGEYELCKVSLVVDCLDKRRSSKPRGPTRQIQRICFDPTRVPREAAGFRVPESPFSVFWNRWFFDALVATNARSVDSLVVWSTDETQLRIPDPMW